MATYSLFADDDDILYLKILFYRIYNRMNKVVIKNRVSKKDKDGKPTPKIIEVRPFYKVVNADGSIEYYNTMGDIANAKNSNVSNISHLTDGKHVKSHDFTVEKESKPYVYTYIGMRYESKNLKEMATICKLSVSTVHKIIVDFVNL